MKAKEGVNFTYDNASRCDNESIKLLSDIFNPEIDEQ